MSNPYFKLIKFNFYEDTLPILKDTISDLTYVALPYIFNSIGFSSKQSEYQMKKIEKDPLLNEHLLKFSPLDYNLLYSKDITCISLSRLQLALSKLSAPRSNQNNKKIGNKLFIYQDELSDALMDEFSSPAKDDHVSNPETLEAIKLLAESINIAFCSIDERLSSLEKKFMETELIYNSNENDPENIVTSEWTGMILQKYKIIAESLGVSYKIVQKETIKRLEKNNRNIKMNEVICSYCNKHNVKTCYPLDAIEDNDTVKAAYEKTIDRMIGIFGVDQNQNKRNNSQMKQ